MFSIKLNLIDDQTYSLHLNIWFTKIFLYKISYQTILRLHVPSSVRTNLKPIILILNIMIILYNCN